MAYFLTVDHSFSHHFWSTLSGKTGSKANLLTAFENASTRMSSYQTAQLDANGNGIANEEEDFAILQKIEGTIYALRRRYTRNLSRPVIGIVSDNQILSGVTSTTLVARSVYDLDGDAIVRVWAEIIRPDYNPHNSSLTVTEIPTVELTDPDGDGVYEGLSSDYDVYFDIEGAYIITLYAKDAHDIVSEPKNTLVVKK